MKRAHPVTLDVTLDISECMELIPECSQLMWGMSQCALQVVWASNTVTCQVHLSLFHLKSTFGPSGPYMMMEA